MAYPERMASVLSGLTRGQLRLLRNKGMVVPEVNPKRPPIYSFRDIIALRTISFLRNKASLQKLSKAWENLDMLDLTKHPSEYRFGTDGKTVFVEDPGGAVVDLVKEPGQIFIFTFEEITKEFLGYGDRPVPDLRHPHDHIEINIRRQRGQPTVEGTRIQSEIIATLVDFETVYPEDIPDHFPHVTEEQARHAVEFHRQVEEVA